MNELVNILTALVMTGVLLFGTGTGIKYIHDTVKKETLEQISKGLSSSEEMANRLTGETLGI